MPFQNLFIAAVAVSTVLTIICAVALVVACRARAETERMLAVVLQTEHEVEQLSRDLDKAAQRANESARRLAWLESRRGGAAVAASEAETLAAETTSEPVNEKTSMTERRHRVLSLARRGLDAKDISSTLGVPHGEVDLIIELSKVA